MLIGPLSQQPGERLQVERHQIAGRQRTEPDAARLDVQHAIGLHRDVASAASRELRVVAKGAGELRGTLDESCARLRAGPLSSPLAHRGRNARSCLSGDSGSRPNRSTRRRYCVKRAS